MWKQFHLEFFIFYKMLNTQNQALVTTTCVNINVIAPLIPKKLILNIHNLNQS